MGAQQLSGFTAKILGRNADVNPLPALQLGLTSGGIFVPLLVDPTGALVVDPSGGSGTVRTLANIAATSSGNVAAGCKSISYASSADFSGTVGGQPFGPSMAGGFQASGNDTLGELVYTMTEGTLYIATLT